MLNRHAAPASNGISEGWQCLERHPGCSARERQTRGVRGGASHSTAPRAQPGLARQHKTAVATPTTHCGDRSRKHVHPPAIVESSSHASDVLVLVFHRHHAYSRPEELGGPLRMGAEQ
jgi:hypothetical protein